MWSYLRHNLRNLNHDFLLQITFLLIFFFEYYETIKQACDLEFQWDKQQS